MPHLRSYDYRAQMIYSEWQDDLLTRKIPLSFPYRLEAILADEVPFQNYYCV